MILLAALSGLARSAQNVRAVLATAFSPEHGRLGGQPPRLGSLQLRHVPRKDRILATILITDIVDSTQRAAHLGDRTWRHLLERHHTLVRRELARFGGREVRTTGDGFLAIFGVPAGGIRCATAIREGVRQLGLEVRCGLHAGEIELMREDIGGIAVHIGARVAAEAEPRSVLVSSTVRDLVIGSEIEFEARGTHTLKGIPGEWQLFAVTSPR
jgi:class 3 adenylate cyclase